MREYERNKPVFIKESVLQRLRGIGYTRKAASKRKKKTTSKFFKNPF